MGALSLLSKFRAPGSDPKGSDYRGGRLTGTLHKHLIPRNCDLGVIVVVNDRGAP